MTTHHAISVTGLCKAYGDHLVLNDIDVQVRRGTVFALLGPNGAGKTTMVQILSTLVPADSGEVYVSGHDINRDPDAVRAAIGVTGQFSAVDQLLTGRENLLLMADLHHLGAADRQRTAIDLLDKFALTAAADKAASTYSGGMRRRLDLAMTLVGRPKLIFLDEPTTGLDPRSRRELWAIVRGLVSGGVTVFLTTQYLEEADQLADVIAVLNHGRLVAQGSPTQLKQQVAGGHVLLQFADHDGPTAAEPMFPGSTIDSEAVTLSIPHDGGVSSLRELLTRIEQSATPVLHLTVHTPDLDDVFLSLTDHQRSKEAVR